MVRVFFALIFVILLFSINAAAQKKLQPLRETASLEEIQNWLSKALKDFSYDSSYNLKFKGCHLTYEDSRSFSSPYTATTSHLPNNSGAAMSSGALRMNRVTLIYSFDLKEMDADKVSFKDSKPSKAQTIHINSKDDKKSVINEISSSRHLREPIYQSYAPFIVKKAYAAQIKDGFVRAIKLCREDITDGGQ